MRVHVLWAAIVVLALAVLTRSVHAVGVISIDFGTEWLKIGLVKRGVAADMVLNAESKRKTPIALALLDNERLFGNPAKSAGMKQPAKCFEYIQPLIGQKMDSPLVKKFQSQFPQYKLEKHPERGTVMFKVADESYSIEEFVAMILEYAVDMATKYSEEPIREAVIIVPPFFSQAERKTILHSAELVGLNVLQLMSDNAAVALNWGVFNKKRFEEKPQTILFYDMGAGSTTATVVEYSYAKPSKSASKVPTLKIKSTAYDRTLGGLEFDLVLRDHLVKIFNEQQKGKNKAEDSPRAMAKILKEANRVKEVLSANTETFAQIEGVFPDVDFKRTKVTRTELEEMCAHLFERAEEPMVDALKAAEITMDQIDQVIMFGGAQRMPAVQASLLKVTGGKELAKSINADEAAAIGGVLQAAAHSKAFRLTPFQVDDAAMFPVALTYPPADENGKLPTDGHTVTKTVFKRSARYPEAKIFSFNKHREDFTFSVNYADLSFLSKRELSYLGTSNITEYTLTGLDEAIEEHKDKSYITTKIKVRMDESGVMQVASATAIFNETLTEEDAKKEGIADKMKSFFGLGGKDKGDDASVEDDNSDAAPADGDAATGEEGQATNATEGDAAGKADDAKDAANATDSKDKASNKTEAKKEAPPKPKEPKQTKVDLKYTERHLDIKPLDAEQIHQIKERLATLRKKEYERVQAMKLKNELESTVYGLYDKLEEEYIDKVATPEALEEIRGFQSECSEWLYGDGVDAPAEKTRERLDKLATMTKPIFHRRDEYLARPGAIEELQKAFERLEKLKDIPESDRHWTEAAEKRVADVVDETRKWLEGKLEEQDKQPLTQDPVFLASELSRKAKRINRDVKILKDTPPPPPPPPPKKTAEAKANATETDENSKNATEADASKPGSEEEKPDTAESQEVPEAAESKAESKEDAADGEKAKADTAEDDENRDEL